MPVRVLIAFEELSGVVCWMHMFLNKRIKMENLSNPDTYTFLQNFCMINEIMFYRNIVKEKYWAFEEGRKFWLNTFLSLHSEP